MRSVSVVTIGSRLADGSRMDDDPRPLRQGVVDGRL
jgi:hypothetical protein